MRRARKRIASAVRRSRHPDRRRSNSRSSRLWPSCSASRRSATARSLPGRRCDDPVHVGLDRRCRKGALSTHRAVTTGTYAYSIGLIVLLGILTEEGRAPADAAAHLAHRALVPRHRRSAGDAQQLRHRPLHGADAQMGPGRGAAPDREGEDHIFRRRADDEPRAHEPPRPAQI